VERLRGDRSAIVITKTAALTLAAAAFAGCGRNDAEELLPPARSVPSVTTPAQQTASIAHAGEATDPAASTHASSRAAKPSARGPSSLPPT
jgi:hypothetical protein